MKRNLFLIALTLSTIGSLSAMEAPNLKNPALKKVQNSLWYEGVSSFSRLSVQSLVETAGKITESTAPLKEELSEELEVAILRAKKL